MTNRTYWAAAERYTTAHGTVMFTQEPFFTNGADSDVAVPCFYCRERIGYAPAVTVVYDEGETWVAAHEACRVDY